MAQSKKKDTDQALREDVYPVTDEAPSQDDKVGAVIGDAGPEDSPVRTQRPDQPIAAVMAGGVGEHKPADPEKFDRDGRYIGPVEVADNVDEADAAREDARAQARETR